MPMIPLDEKYGIVHRRQGGQCISFDVPDDWYEIVDEAFTRLSELPEWDPSLVAQVKEKFDELRIYLHGDLELNPVAQDIIRQAEVKVRNLKK